jgi:hypothetical protein
MNTSASWLRFAWRAAEWILVCSAASLLVVTLVAASESGTAADHEGASPYTPRKGEWLCLFLNSRQALVNSELARSGIGVNYFYDLSKPDSIQIEVLYCQGTRDEQVQRWEALAKRRATEAAKIHGWQNWLKIEFTKQKVVGIDASDVLIR